MAEIPTKARAVVIGGGVSGCSVAYHLAKAGWTDVVLLERRKLTSGTTWHAAGLIGQLRGSANMTRLAKYSADLYRGLEAETGVATGMKQVGSISVALTPERHEELLRQATVARIFDVDVHEISPAEVKQRYPHLNVSDVVGAVALPLDGQCDPANIAMALAKGARMRGAKIFENTLVTKVTTANGRVTGVDYETAEGPGHIAADVIVNCGGMWGRDLAQANGVTLPLHACEHFYLITEPVAGLDPMTPVLRVPDECAYYKQDAGKMMLGAFEPKAKPWGMDGIRKDFEFDTLPEDWDRFMPILEQAMNRMPLFQTAGIHTFFNKPFWPTSSKDASDRCHSINQCYRDTDFSSFKSVLFFKESRQPEEEEPPDGVGKKFTKEKCPCLPESEQFKPTYFFKLRAVNSQGFFLIA